MVRRRSLGASAIDFDRRLSDPSMKRSLAQGDKGDAVEGKEKGRGGGGMEC